MIKTVFMLQNSNMELINRVYSLSSIDMIRQYASIYPEYINKDNMKEHKDYLRDVEVAFSTWGMLDLSEDEIKQYFPNLKVIFYAAGSVQAFARPYLNKGITIVSAWAANAVPVAEFTIAQILLANKGFYQNCMKAKKDSILARKFSEAFAGNYNTNIGIIGAGMVGTEVIKLLKPFNLNVWVFDPYLSDEKAKNLGVRKCSLIEIFSHCQTISNHIANLPDTHKILNKEHFSMMLPYATFINTGRGAQVIEEDLISALKEVPTRTAVLDVTDPEPPMAGSDLFDMENIILTTHIAGSMGCEVERMGLYMAEEFASYVNGRELKYNITLKMLDTMA